MIENVNVNTDVANKTNEIITVVNDHDSKIMNLLSWMGLVKDYVIETGSNANGSYEKWASGKLVQWGNVQKSSVSLTQIGDTPFYWLPNVDTSDYPIPFVGTLPTVTFDVNRISNAVWGNLVNTGRALTKPGLYDIYGTSSTMNSHAYSYHAIGRWK